MGEIQSANSKAPQASRVTLDVSNHLDCETVLEFLIRRFPHVSAATWIARVEAGEVSLGDMPVDAATPFQGGATVSYFRSVSTPQERPSIGIVHEDEEILVADKPHGISVTPTGEEVGGCLLYRLWDHARTGELTPVHRIDRDTAGLVLFVKRAADRGTWQVPFAEGNVDKLYFATAELRRPLLAHYWSLSNRIERAENGERQRRVVPEGVPNASSEVFYAGEARGLPGREHAGLPGTSDLTGDSTPPVGLRPDGNSGSSRAAAAQLESATLGRFWIRPRTGKQHQIRVHLAYLGYPIWGDAIYGKARSLPLQLLSRELRLRHPRSGEMLRFQSRRCLETWGGDTPSSA